MDTSGDVVPSGQGTLYQYKIEEYDTLPFSLDYGKPYRVANSEIPVRVDS